MGIYTRIVASSEISFYVPGHQQGILHLIGNAAEWTSSIYEAYPGGSLTGAEVGTHAVVRGGDYTKFVVDSCTATFRDPIRPDARKEFIGFRCAKNAADSANR